jgi:hypothetical protein
MVDGASILDFAPGPQKVRNGPASELPPVPPSRQICYLLAVLCVL